MSTNIFPLADYTLKPPSPPPLPPPVIRPILPPPDYVVNRNLKRRIETILPLVQYPPYTAESQEKD